MVATRHDIFLHFLNRDSRQIYGLFREFEPLTHATLLNRALTAAAVLCETRCIAPPGFIIECDVAQSVLTRQVAYLRERVVELPMREDSLTSFAEKKRHEYAPMRDAYAGLFDDQRIRFLSDNAAGLIPRRAAIGKSIAKKWLEGPDTQKRLWRPVTSLVRAPSIEFLRTVPEDLIGSGTAATWHAILERLPEETRIADRDLRRILQHDYFTEYVREFGLQVISNVPLMQDSFGLPSRSNAYNYEWLRACLAQVELELLLDADANAIVTLRSQHGFIRFIDAFVGLCSMCQTVTDLRYHLDRLARASNTSWRRLASLWSLNPATKTFELGESKLVELADALGGLAARVEAEFSLSVRIHTSPTKADRIVRGKMKEDTPELVIFVALEEEFEILQKRWGLRRAFGDYAARGTIKGFMIDVVCARSMGRVSAAVTMGLYLLERKDPSLKLILVVGLAGGFEEEKIQEGMILIPHTVVDLATRKVTDIGEQQQTEFRRRDFSLDTSVYEYVKSNDFDDEEWQRIATDFADWPSHRRPSFHTGLITSLDEVVSSENWRKMLLDATPKLIGVEMEAGGVCAAVEKRRVPVSMIRAVSDNADPAKTDTAWRPRGMKTLATLVEAIDWQAITSRLPSR